MSQSVENVVIVGTGCAGLTAAIYTARANLNPLVLEGTLPGGQLTTTSEVENFPGFPNGIDGYQLMQNLREQATKFGTRFEQELVTSVDFSSMPRKLICWQSRDPHQNVDHRHRSVTTHDGYPG